MWTPRALAWANPSLPDAGGQATVSGQVFGISFTELALILVVALVVLGPQRLPDMLRTVGLWIHKVRRMTTEVRQQTGIDDLLRQEGFEGGLSELRSLLRGDPRALIPPGEGARPTGENNPYWTAPTFDKSREQPVEGPDAQGAIPDDLVDVDGRIGTPQPLSEEQLDVKP
jgi:sec-independent protein translocase protein TatB